MIRKTRQPRRAFPILLAFLFLAPCCALRTAGSLGTQDAGPDQGTDPVRDGLDLVSDPDVVDDTEDGQDVAPEPDVPGTCATGGECNDLEPCDGMETCSASGYCMEGEAPPEGSTCVTMEGVPGTCAGFVCAPGTCGDGVLDIGEVCDDGNRNDNDACTNACRPAACNDGIVYYGWEQCDPPGTVQACTSHCMTAGEQTCASSCAWSSCAPPAEACNSIDDDCDGVVDVAYGRITFDSGESIVPSLVWTGSEFAVAWTEGRDLNREIYFGRVAPDGSRMDADSRITATPPESFEPALVWSGAGYAVAWSDGPNNEAYTLMALIDAAGAKVGGDVQVSAQAKSEIGCSAAWTGSEYGVSWTDTRNSGQWDIYFVRVSASGAKIGGDYNVTSANNGSGGSSLVWTGSEFGAAWHDNRDSDWEIYFAPLRPDGQKRIGEVRITRSDGESKLPSLAWTGSEYGVAWSDLRDGNREIYFARLDSNGAKQGGDVRITSDGSSSASPSLAWSGSEFMVAWEDARDGNSEIYYARISPLGAKVGPDSRMTVDPARSGSPSAVWSGAHFNVAWQDDRDGNFEIYFATLLCL